MIYDLSTWVSGYNFLNSLGSASGMKSVIALESQIDK
jgi:hypothetical protein